MLKRCADLIDTNYPTVNVNSTVEQAIDLFEAESISLLPLIDDNKFVGFLELDTLYEVTNTYQNLNGIKTYGSKCFISADRHLFEAAKLMSDYDFDLVALVNDNGNYIGVLTGATISKYFGASLGMQLPGGIIVLQVDGRDYSLTEITRLIESNGVKIFGLVAEAEQADAKTIALTLKLSTPELNRTIATLERFGYNVVAYFGVSDLHFAHTERLGFLMRYLDI